MNITPTENEIKYIREELNQFNNERVGEDGHTPLNIVEYDTNGNIIGGILGGTYWGWMYVDILWVHENHRKKGVGSNLLHKAEEEALRRGCHHARGGFLGRGVPQLRQGRHDDHRQGRWRSGSGRLSSPT